MIKLFATILISVLLSHSHASVPFSEDMDMSSLFRKAELVVLGELYSGSYDRKEDSYTGKLLVKSTVKGKKTKKLILYHKHGWNRLETLGGFYILYLDRSKELIQSGSSIVPLVSFGGPFSDATLEEAAKTYKLPVGSWFVNSNQLWGLKNCLYTATPTCEREMELVKYTFNKALQDDR